MLPRRLLPALLILLVLCAHAAQGASGFPAVRVPANSEVRNVLLIGWDGAQREHLQQCLNRGELPNLAALGRAGALVDVDVTETTDTKAGWSQILTGYSAKVTGVYSNRKYQPIPRGLTIFERLEQFYGPQNIATLAVIGKDEHVGNNPPEKIKLNAAGSLPAAGLGKGKGARKAWRNKLGTGKVIEEDGAKYLSIPGKPYYLTQEAMDLFQNGLHQNEKVGARALEVLQQYKDRRFFMFVHFADVDSQGHKFGENSAEYTAALSSCDDWLGRLEQKLSELGLLGTTLIYVTADHGFDEGQRTHQHAQYVFLATNDATVKRNGTRADVTPTIMHRLGLDLSKLDPPLDGRPLN
jgi:hypothetical protein